MKVPGWSSSLGKSTIDNVSVDTYVIAHGLLAVPADVRKVTEGLDR